MEALKDFELPNGFEATVAVAGDYYKLTYNGQTLYQDSANSDCYDKDSAEAFFTSLLDELDDRGQNIIIRAIVLGCRNDVCFNNIELTLGACEDFLLETIDSDDEEQCDLCNDGRSQYYTYGSKSCSGEIFDFSDRRTKQYYKDADFTSMPVALYEIDEDEEERYAFIFDRYVDKTAHVISLYDYLK